MATSKELKHKVELTIGDWSMDGHNQMRHLLIDSNLTQSEIEDSYKAGCKIVGFNFSEIVCREYEDSSIKKDKIDKLKAAGIDWGDEDAHNPLEFDDGVDEDGSQCLDYKSFCNIYLAIVKLGNSNFIFKYIKAENSTINIGGYGLFYQ